MELIKSELDGKFLKYDLHYDDKHLVFSDNFLNHIKISFFHDDGKKLGFNEHFDVKKDSPIYDLTSSVFFSYGGNVSFDTDGAGLSLERNKDGDYSFVFDRTFNEQNNVIESFLNSYSIEDESLRTFFKELDKINSNEKNTSLKKVLTRKQIIRK